MTGDHCGGFGEVVRLADAQARLREAVTRHGRRDTVPIADAAGRSLVEPVTADRDVPHYDRAAMDGYAIRATETHDASERAPRSFALVDGAVGPGEARQVHTGSALPDGADAVVPVEAIGRVDDRIEVGEAVAVGANVALAGEDVVAGDFLFEPGHRLQPADLALCRAAGVTRVTVAEPPRVAVVPTGDELVRADPAPGEVVETNGLAVSRLVERWGGTATYGDIVPDDEAALQTAIDNGTDDHDLVVTLGGSSVGERDLVPDVVADLGELSVHGVAIKPGHPAGLGTVSGTPVLVLPGYPVSALVTAVQILRPAVAYAAGVEPSPLPAARGRLVRRLASEPGVRTFARVRFAESEAGGEASGDEPAARRPVEPIRAGGAGVLSSVTAADGWVVVPESREGYEAGAVVDVEQWDRRP